MSGSAIVTTQVGSSCLSASVSALAAARCPPPVSLNRIRIFGALPLGVGLGGACSGDQSAGSAVPLPTPRRGSPCDPAHVVLGKQVRHEHHRDDAYPDPEDGALGQLPGRQRDVRASELVLLDDEGREVLDVLVRDLSLPSGHLGAGRGLPAVRNRVDQEGRIERIGNPWQVGDGVERRPDVSLEARTVAGGAVLLIGALAIGRVARQRRSGGRRRRVGQRRDAGQEQKPGDGDGDQAVPSQAVPKSHLGPFYPLPKWSPSSGNRPEPRRFYGYMGSCSPLSGSGFTCVTRRWLDARSAYRG